jgi:hypothetical protein
VQENNAMMVTFTDNQRDRFLGKMWTLFVIIYK